MLKPLSSAPQRQPKPLRCRGKVNDDTKPSLSVMRPNAGFSLIELMVVVAIIAILATIAVPSYRDYVKQNAEHQAQQRTLTISNELSSWRSKSLSYKGFIPRNEGCASGDFCYSQATTGVIYVPLGSTAASHSYAITINDAQAAVSLTQPAAGGKGWQMLVVPNKGRTLLASANRYYLDSLGQKCQYKASAQLPTLPVATLDCTRAGMSIW